MDMEGANAVSGLSVENGAATETSLRRVSLKNETVGKMARLYPLFADKEAKEPEIIAFFVELAFASFLTSGEVERRVAAITGNAAAGATHLIVDGKDGVCRQP